MSMHNDMPSAYHGITELYVCTVCVCVLGSRSVDQKMVERFMVATDCWDFLQSNVTYQQGVAY